MKNTRNTESVQNAKYVNHAKYARIAENDRNGNMLAIKRVKSLKKSFQKIPKNQNSLILALKKSNPAMGKYQFYC